MNLSQGIAQNPAPPAAELRRAGNLPLTRSTRAALWALLAVFVVFGGIVEMRSAFLKRRLTDVDVFFRGAWAVRSGIDMYSVTETHGWHYNYPPLFAILMTPLASPPPGSDETGMLPYPVSVAVWYVANVAFVWLAVHWLASALARAAPEPWAFARHSRGWWAIRILPVLLCLTLIGRSLSRGQSNLLLLLLFCGTIALLIRDRRFAAGICLAGAICIKVFPGFLLIHPLVRGDFRFLAGAGAGLFCGLLLIPAVALGPARTVDAYRRFDQVMLRPGLRIGSDTTREDELTKGRYSQGFMMIARNLLHPRRETRPHEIGRSLHLLHWGLATLLTAATLFIRKRPRRQDPISEVLFMGALMVIMLPISPACHVHYFVFALPLVMALLADAWERFPFPSIGPRLSALFGIVIGADILTALPWTDNWLRELGVPLYAGLALWAIGLYTLRRRAREATISP